MTFLKQNWFKVIILIIISIFGLYYFTKIVPARELDNKIVYCRNLGEEYRKNETREAPNISFLVPNYTYNKDLRTCIYSGGFIDGKLLNKYIIDLNTNTTIVDSYYQDTKFVGGLSTEEFNAKEKTLLNK